jgi:GDP-L-fucose synthase
VAIWGTGTPKREFLYVDDMAAASVHVMHLPKATYDQHTAPMQSHINVGFGSDITIAELARTVGQVVATRARLTLTPANQTARPAS